MTNDVSGIELIPYEEPTIFDRVLALVFIVAVIALVLVITYYIGAYNTVKDMEASFSDHGEVILQFHGFVYPPIFDSL